MKFKPTSLAAALACLVLLVATAYGQSADKRILTLDRIFSSSEFRSETFGPARWLDDGSAYTTLEPSADNKETRDIIRYETATGARSVLIAAASLRPGGASAPLVIDDYAWSDRWAKAPDLHQHRTGLAAEHPRRLLGLRHRGEEACASSARDAGASTLMFAKFSPDGTRVGYVRENNLYVEDLATGRITQLTRDGSKRIINGTFDWVYEEELDLRDGWRWSPDGTQHCLLAIRHRRRPGLSTSSTTPIRSIRKSSRFNIR